MKKSTHFVEEKYFLSSLNPRTLNEHEEQLFCNVCYEKIFNPAEFTVENYGGVITPEDIERYLSYPTTPTRVKKEIRKTWEDAAWLILKNTNQKALFLVR